MYKVYHLVVLKKTGITGIGVYESCSWSPMVGPLWFCINLETFATTNIRCDPKSFGISCYVCTSIIQQLASNLFTSCFIPACNQFKFPKNWGLHWKSGKLLEELPEIPTSSHQACSMHLLHGCMMYAKANVKVNSNLRKRLLLPSLPSLSLSSISWITGRNSSVTVWTDQPQPSLLWRWRPDHQLHGHNYGPMALELITKWLVTTISPIIQSTANSTNILLYESWAITHNSIQVFVPHSDYIFTVMYVTSTNAWCIAWHCRPLHGLTTLGICKVQQRFFRLKSSWNLYLPIRRPRAATTSGTILGTIESLLHEFGDLLCIQASLALFPWRDSVEWQQFWKKAKVNLSKVISNIYLSTL